MKNILSTLKEKVTLLQYNEDINSTTIAKFKDSLNARASIQAIFNSEEMSSNMFRIIILKPPREFSKINFSGVKWRNEIYTCKTPFKPFKTNFLEGTITKCY